MASDHITAWQIEGEKVEEVTDFLSLGSKIVADGDYSQEFRRWLLLTRKAMTNLDHVLKIRDITLPTKVHTVMAMVFLGEGNGHPLQYSCLENPVDRGAWWAAVYGVAQSRIRQKPLSSSSSMLNIQDGERSETWNLSTGTSWYSQQ